jgi:3-dehydroquinate dehydratase-2
VEKLVILHGVNLNTLGKRNPEQYGTMTLQTIDDRIRKLASELKVEVECFQTNNEGEMVERIQRCYDENVDGVIINAGAWTHYSHSISDALEMLKIPVIEVHISNLYAREKFRHFSVVAPLAKGQITGFGINSYLLGVRAAVDLLRGDA